MSSLRRISEYVILGVLLSSFSIPSLAQTSIINRDLQQLEQERERAQLRRELEAMREQQTPTAPEPSTQSQAPGGQFQFVLQKISHTPSEVLTDEEIAQAVAPWVGRIVRAEDLGEMLEAINALYRSKGYAVCQAALRAQRIRQGHLTVTLIEGKTDEVVIRGLENTNPNYVARAFDLPLGQVANYRDMYENLVRFNMTNDVHLSIDIHAGDKPETTAYDIIAQEPQRWSASLFADTLGTESTGEYRAGASIVNRSVFGWRDSMYLMGIASEGSQNVLWGYSIPLDSFGTRLITNASFGQVDVIDGPNDAYDVSGESMLVSARLEHPFAVAENYKWIAYGEYKHQRSETEMYGDLLIAKTNIDAGTLGIDTLYIGDQWSMYLNNHVSFHEADEELFGNTYDYTIYGGDFFAQTLLTDHLSLQMTAAWQAKLGGDAMVSSDQFYLGNTSGVRGYDNDVISSENGFWVNLEAHYRWDDQLNTFVFFDAGRLSGLSSYEKRELYSSGLGLEWRPFDWVHFKGTVACPLTKRISPFEKADSVRYDAVMTLVY